MNKDKFSLQADRLKPCASFCHFLPFACFLALSLSLSWVFFFFLALGKTWQSLGAEWKKAIENRNKKTQNCVVLFEAHPSDFVQMSNTDRAESADHMDSRFLVETCASTDWT